MTGTVVRLLKESFELTYKFSNNRNLITLVPHIVEKVISDCLRPTNGKVYILPNLLEDTLP